MKSFSVWIFTAFALLLTSLTYTHAHIRHGRRHHVCTLTTQSIQDALSNPCNTDSRPTYRHPMEPSNICFQKDGRIMTSLQAMLNTLNQTYNFNPQDMELLFEISLELPTTLEEYTTAEYARVVRLYYRELACLSVKMSQASVSLHSRSRQQHLCNIVSRFVRPMLCVDADYVDMDLPQDCSDWDGIDPSDVDFYGYWTIKYFQQFLASLSPNCRIVLRG